MNILYIPLPGTDLSLDGFYKSLSKRHTVCHYWDKKDAWGHMMEATMFDVCHFQFGAIEYQNLKSLRRLLKEQHGAVITAWTGDYRPEPMEMITQYNGLVDISFLAADVPELYPEMNVVWMPHGVDDWNFLPVREDATGVVMVANNYTHFPGGKERNDLYEMLINRDDFRCYGNGFKGHGHIHWKYVPDIYNRAEFVVGGNIYNDAKLYFSNRPLWAMAAGSCMIMRRVPGIDDLFGDKKDCFIYDTNEEAIEIINSTDTETRNIIAKQGQKKVKEFHFDKLVEIYEKAINEL